MEDSGGEDEFIDPPPPSPEKVARRAIILAVITCRGIIDTQPEAESLAKNSFQWLRALDLENEMTDWEAGILSTPFGTLSDRDRINASWLSEALVVLAWALGKIEMLAFEEQCDPSAIANTLGFLQTTSESILASPQLRPSEELHDYNEFIYNVHWRLRDFSLGNRPYDFTSLARKAWGEPLIKYGLKLAESDLSVGGAPLSRAAAPQVRSLTSITQERHRASNWLIGYASEDFYEVSTDT